MLGDDRGADRRGDVVIAGRDIGDERAERIERRPMAPVLLQPHVFLHEVERHMARALDHHLDVVRPRPPRELGQRTQLGELSLVVGVGDRTGPQPVAEREGDVVLREDLAQLVEILVEERLLVVRQAPARHDRPATGHDARDALGGEGDIAEEDAGVDRHIVHALLGLLDHGVAEDLPRQLVRLAIDLFQSLVDRHGPDRDG